MRAGRWVVSADFVFSLANLPEGPVDNLTLRPLGGATGVGTGFNAD
jgi:hypothetical protein